MAVEHDTRTRETIHWASLPSGLQVAVLPRPGWQETTAQIAVNYGANDISFVPPGEAEPITTPAGIAHFLEHKLFESESGDAMAQFSALGAECNAYTSKTQTVYYFTATDHFSDNLDILLNMVQEPWFTADSVAKERGIIEQEIRMYDDNPDIRSWQNMLEAMYREHPVRVGTAGTVESIGDIDSGLLYRCHATFYHPSNMLLFIAGDVDTATVLEQVQTNIERRNYRFQGEIGRVAPPEPAPINERRREQSLLVNQPLYRLAFKEQELSERGHQLLRKELLTNLVLEAIAARASKLYDELYEAGLIDLRFGFDYTGEISFGHTSFAGPTRHPQQLEERLLNGLAAAQEEGLDPAEFERAKRKTLGRFIASLNSTGTIAYLVNDGFFKDIRIFDVLPMLEALTVADGNKRLRSHFDPDFAVTSIIWPLQA